MALLCQLNRKLIKYVIENQYIISASVFGD